MKIDPLALRRAREDAGLTLAQVGEPELTRQAVHQMETGKIRPTIESLRLMAQRLGRPVGSFLAARPDAERPVSPDGPVRQLEELCQRHEYELALKVANRVLRLRASRSLEAFAHFYAGLAQHNLDRPVDSLKHLRRAQKLFEQADNPWYVAEAMDWEAAALYRTGRVQECLALAEDALRRYRLLEPRRPETEARMLEHIGIYLAGRDAYDQAQSSFQAALRVMGSVRDLEAMGRIYHGLAACSRSTGDLRTATENIEKAVTFYSVEHQLRPTAARLLLPSAQNDLGMLLMETGQWDRAERMLQAALGGFTSAGAERYRCRVLLGLGELRQRQGRLEEAFEIVRDAIELGDRLGHALVQGKGHQQLAELSAAAGQGAQSDDEFQRALAIFEKAGLEELLAACRSAHERLRGGRGSAAAGDGSSG